jgi:hypothetical protein
MEFTRAGLDHPFATLLQFYRPMRFWSLPPFDRAIPIQTLLGIGPAQTAMAADRSEDELPSSNRPDK